MKRNGRLVKRIVTQESVNRYCEWLYGCEKSSGTIKQYKHYLLLFMQYMNGKSVEKRDVIMWKGILRERLPDKIFEGKPQSILSGKQGNR